MSVRLVDIKLIKQNDNSRTGMDHIAMAKLMRSMDQDGLLHAIGIVKNGKGFHCAYGNRRLVAARKLGWKKIEAKVLEHESEDQDIVVNINENLNRADITLCELGRMVSSLYTDHKLDEHEIGARLQLLPNQVKDCLELYRQVPKKYHKKVTMRGEGTKTPRPGKLSASSARRIIDLNKRLPKAQAAKLFEFAVEKGLPERSLHAIAAHVKAGATLSSAIKEIDNSRVVRMNIRMSEINIKRLEKEHKKQIGVILTDWVGRKFPVLGHQVVETRKKR